VLKLGLGLSIALSLKMFLLTTFPAIYAESCREKFIVAISFRNFQPDFWLHLKKLCHILSRRDWKNGNILAH